MNIAIMQPYFFPYVGYFQLIKCAEVFVVYDNIQYTKKGWINRNRYLKGDGPAFFTLSLQKDSDSLEIRDRRVAPSFDKTKLLNVLRAAYRRAPHFCEAWALIEEIVGYSETNLFAFLHHSLLKICDYLDIRTPIIISSTIEIDHTLRGQDKVLAICKQLGASTYTNPIGGISLYSKEVFQQNGISLRFLEPYLSPYTQGERDFVPGLSILDVIMFNKKELINSHLLQSYMLL